MIHGLYDGKLPNGGNADGLFLKSGRIMQSRIRQKGPVLQTLYRTSH
jgi:sialidase-1